MTAVLAAVAVGLAAVVALSPPSSSYRLLAVLPARVEGRVPPAPGEPPLPRRLSRQPRGRWRRNRRPRPADPRALAVALELVAACLAAGRPMPDALQVVAAGVEGAMSRWLAQAAAALRAGAAPAEAWAPWLDDERLAPVARALIRATGSGAPVAQTVLRAAARCRAMARTDAERAARAVSVWAVLPLGLCFLPAFVLVGVVPAVVALLGEVL